MPNKDLTLDEHFEAGWISSGREGDPPTPDYSIYFSTQSFDGHPTFRKEFRLSTDRNSISKRDKPLRSCLRPPTLQVKRVKPKREDESPEERLLRKEFAPRKEFKPFIEDFRKEQQLLRVANKMARKLQVPEGYVRKNIETGNYKLEQWVNPDDRFQKTQARWVPEVVSRIVRKDFRRKHPRLPVDAKVNDLLFFKSKVTPIDANTPLRAYKAGTEGGPPFVEWDGTNCWMFPWNLYSGATVPIFDPNTQVAKQADLPGNFAEHISRLSSLALTRLYGKLKNQKIDLATELSQGLQTVNLIGDAAKRLASTFLKLKKFDLIGAARELFPKNRKELANDRLAYVYGIKPLISDIQGAAEHLAEYIQRAAPVKYNGHAKARFVDQKPPKTDVLSPGVSMTTNLTITTEIRIKYGTTFGVPDKLLRQASQLGFTNPANTIWELVPFSFVVDWFLPIGNFLNNLTALKGLEIRETYKTTFIKQSYLSYTALPLGLVPDPDDGTEFVWDMTSHGATPMVSYFGWLAEVIYVKREVIPNLPDLPLPSFKNPVSRDHILNALSLFSQHV